ncbi:MAG: hypothetical protein IKH30_12425 [Clostridia bacterium]|nr:hypothetical protein [Clostridia bacterium]
MKKAMRVLALVMLAVLLTGCAAQEQTFPDADTAQASAQQKNPMDLSTAVPRTELDLPEGYDPASEENDADDLFNDNAVYDDYGRNVYAGATPIPIDPIDMPTATPKPTLKFEYGTVSAEKIRLMFDVPQGWGIDDSASDAITVINPTELDGVNAQITVRVYTVASTFKTNDLKAELRTTLKELGQYNFAKWKTTELAERTILKKDGFYADYEGTYLNGISIYGRVMMALLDNNQVIMLHLFCPDGYFNSSYKTVINHVRDSLKQI